MWNKGEAEEDRVIARDRVIAVIGKPKFFFTAKDAKGAKEQTKNGRDRRNRTSSPKSEKQKLTADLRGSDVDRVIARDREIG